MQRSTTRQKSTRRWLTLLGMLLVLGVLASLLSTPLSMPLHAQEGPSPSDGGEEPTAQLFTQGSSPIPPFTPGTVLVGVRGDVVSAASAWDGVEVLAVESLDLRTSAVSAASTDGAADTLTGYKLTVPVGTEWSAVETLLARDDVAFAEPDWLAQIAQVNAHQAAVETPFAIADTLYPDQWYLQRIGLSRAWALALAESSLEPIEIAVIDTGVDFDHPDLANRLFAGHNYLDETQTPVDDNGHGTHISGLIAAAVNGDGMVGAGRQVKVIPLKALNENGLGGVSGIAQAIRDAADDEADIINLSLELNLDTFVLRSAVEYAVSQEVLVIAASGNQGRASVSYPAAYPGVLAVGATTYSDMRAFYSNRGPELDLVAPGGGLGNSILSTWTRDTGATCPSVLRQVNAGLYCQADGTSMATGIVSGVAALVWSLRPELSATEVQEILLESATPIPGSASDVGRGRLDAARAVRLALLPRLILEQNQIEATSVVNGDPIALSLSLTNPSLTPLTVEISPTNQVTWYDVVGARSGEVRYGEPLSVQLVFTPTAVGAGHYTSDLYITVTGEDGEQNIYTVGTRFDVSPAVVGDAQMFMPWASGQSGNFQWAEPGYTGRTSYAISADSSIVLDLPFTLTVGGRNYTDLRIYADGFVVAPASAFVANLPNHCLENQTWPSFVVYGWWSDLSLDGSSNVSTFQPDADHFVIEYGNMISEDSSDPEDRVSFQIMLQQAGHIQLSYAQVPAHAPSILTVGASTVDGRFFNQITCFMEDATRIGLPPAEQQTFTLRPEDLY